MKQLVEEQRRTACLPRSRISASACTTANSTAEPLKVLIKAGSFDSMHYYRSQLLKIVNPVVDAIAQNRKKNIEGQMDLFGMGNDEVRDTQIAMPNIPEVPKRELLAMEKETTGLYLSGHPMDEYRSLTQKAQAASVKQIIDDLTGESSKPVYKDGMTVRLACVLSRRCV